MVVVVTQLGNFKELILLAARIPSSSYRQNQLY